MSDDLLNISDSEIDALGGVVAWAQQQRAKGATSMENFRRAVVEKFAEVGFAAKVKAYETSEKDTYAFEFEIYGRTQVKAFDFDQMRWEVRNNILGLPGQEKGELIKADAELARLARHDRFHGKKCGH